MKRIILTMAVIMAVGFANAQNLKSKKGENYLPEANDWAISFNANGVFNYVGNLFNGNPLNAAPTVANVTANSLVGKKFIDAKSAYRVVANVGFGSNNLTGDSTSLFDTYKASTLNFNLGLGKEWRRGSTRLQGFYGADALVGFASQKWSETNNPVANATYKAGTSINLGVNGFIGAEYFIFPKMSIGAQYNYGLQVAANGASNYKLGTVEVKGKSTSNINFGNVSSTSMNLTLHF
jgi:hypothetical protein